MWQIFVLYKICLRKDCHSETISILTSHPHCWVPEHFYHPQTKPRTHELSLPVTPPSTHNLWQAHLLSVSVDLHVLDILYKWSSTVGYEAFHIWLCHSAWCLQGSSCCSLCVNSFFFNMAKPCSIVWIYHILCTHSSVDGHFSATWATWVWEGPGAKHPLTDLTDQESVLAGRPPGWCLPASAHSSPSNILAENLVCTDLRTVLLTELI